MRFLQWVFLASAVAFCAPKPNLPPAKNPTSSLPALDSAAVHTVYLEGDFEEAAVILEQALESAVLSHGDSTFIFRHLGVIYAAREETREKGKYFMYKLLVADPMSNILDMYASDMIYMVFNHVKAEFDAGRERASRAKKPGDDTSRAASTGPKLKKRKSGQAVYWWFGGTVLVAAAAGAGVFLYYEEPPDPIVNKKTYAPD